MSSLNVWVWLSFNSIPFSEYRMPTPYPLLSYFPSSLGKTGTTFSRSLHPSRKVLIGEKRIKQFAYTGLLHSWASFTVAWKISSFLLPALSLIRVNYLHVYSTAERETPNSWSVFLLQGFWSWGGQFWPFEVQLLHLSAPVPTLLSSDVLVIGHLSFTNWPQIFFKNWAEGLGI